MKLIDFFKQFPTSNLAEIIFGNNVRKRALLVELQRDYPLLDEND
jgi:hypothetical protein